MPIPSDIVPDAVDALKAALVAERSARQQAEARASGAEALVAHLKLVIAKLRRERFGPSAERGSQLLDQLELQLEELEASATEDELAAKARSAEDGTVVTSFTRKKPVRAPFPAHLPRERVVIPAPAACPCCGGKLAKLGEDVTETLEVVPRQWKVVQTVREKFTCRSCEKITQPPAPFHTIARGRAGASLLAMILYAKYGPHQPLNRQSESFAREGIELDVSTMADWVGACAAALAPLVELIRHHVLDAARLHGDDTTVPVLATGKTVTGRVWAYVRDDRPFAGPAPPAAMFCYSRNRDGEHPKRHLADYAGILQADAGACPRVRPRAGPGGRVQWALRSDAKSGANHRGGLLEPWTAEVLCPGRDRQVCPRQGTGGAPRHRSGAPDRRDIRNRGRDQRIASGAASRGAHSPHCAIGGRARKLDAYRAGPAVPPCRCRQSDGLHAEALGRLHPLPQ